MIRRGGKQTGTFDITHYTNMHLQYIGIVGHTVPDDAVGYEQYEGKLIHWHLAAGWSTTALEGNKLPSSLDSTEAYHFDTAKPYLGKHQIDILINRLSYTIPHRSPTQARLFFKVNKTLTASQVEGSIIKAHNLHNYEYNGEYSGCLCWSRSLLKKLADLGYIDTEAVASFEKEIIQKLRSMKDGAGVMYHVPPDDGKFFKKNGSNFDDFVI